MQSQLVCGQHLNLSEAVPFQPLHDLRQRPPAGVFPIGVRLSQGSAAFRVPALREHLLAIQLRQSARVRGQVVRPFEMHSQPGDIVLTPPGEATEWHYQGTPDVLILFLNPDLFRDMALQSLDIDPRQIEFEIQLGTTDAFVHSLGQTFLEELQYQALAGPIFLESLTQTLIIHLIRTYAALHRPLKQPTHYQSNPHVLQAREYIHEHLHQRLTLADIAAAVNLSPYHLGRVFKQQIGQSLHQYVIAQRLERGRALLTSSNLTVASIAEQLGFADHSHFTRLFKRRYGISPSALARKHPNLPG